MHMTQLMPLPLTVSCFSKIQIGFTFLVPAHLGRPGKMAVKWVCVCVCVTLGHIASAHGSLHGIRPVTLMTLSNGSLGRVCLPNGVSINSADFARLTGVLNTFRQIHRP